MIDPVTLRRWGFALLFLALSATVIFIRMLPIGPVTGTWPPPDLIVLLGFTWVLRRPDFVPVVLFAALLLTAELLFLRPPGPATALAVVGLEFLRGRARLVREQSFPLEWATVAAVLALMVLGERIVLAMFFVAQPPVGLALLGLAINIAAYPVVVGVSIWGLGVRRLAPGEHAAEARLV